MCLLGRGNDNRPKIEEFNGFQIIRAGAGLPAKFSIPVSFNPLWRKEIAEAISYFKPDIVIPREVMLAEAAADISHRKNIPVILDMAENYPEVMRGWKKYYNRYLYRIPVHYLKIPDKIEKNSVQKSDGIITVCDEMKNRISQIYNYSSEKIEVVHNTPCLEHFDGVRTGSSNPPKIFAYHGYINYERNLEMLIRGFIIASERNPEIELVLAGEGEEYDDLLRLANNSPAKDKIHFRGKYSFGDLNRLMSEMDVGILPYRLNDHINFTISNKLFDYIAVGKPVIVAEAPPMIRIIQETETGISADCSDENAIAEAICSISDYDLEAFSKNGIKAAKNKYNWDTDINILINFLNKYL
ncbi:MAG: hypothetical protein QG635_1375 [Bacteroidota bacterium]|nr:hypothetical protein [Bacteroidota bacterium]